MHSSEEMAHIAGDTASRDAGPYGTRKLTLLDRDVFEQFVHPGEVVEVRILKARGKSPAWGHGFANGTASGYFDDHAKFCEAVKAAGKVPNAGIYYTLQVIDPRLLGRAFNRVKAAEATTSDRDVLCYRWLPVDIDPVRPSGTPSSDRELSTALELRDAIAEWAMDELSFPAPVRAVSGNGGHLLFRLPDMPVSEESQAFVKGMLEEIARRFDSDTTAIDTTVSNPARIWKLYGTTARKGDEVPAGPFREARSHRMAYIDTMGG